MGVSPWDVCRQIMALSSTSSSQATTSTHFQTTRNLDTAKPLGWRLSTQADEILGSRNQRTSQVSIVGDPS